MSHADAPAETAQQAVLHRVTDTRLRGGWLVLARVVWVALIVLALGLFFGSLPIGLFFYLFPTGRFVPGFTRWLALGWIAFWVLQTFFPTSPLSNPWLSGVLFLGLIASLIVLQVYRYRRVSSPLQRQQTKWVVFGIVLAFGSFVSGSTVLETVVPLHFSFT